jgi:hypothetical protein
MTARRVPAGIMAVLALTIGGIVVAAPSQATGEYDYYCTGYNGRTIGWNNKSFHACHGYLDVYISGRHVGHHVPDAYPTGSSAQLACSRSANNALIMIASLSRPLNPIGWLGSLVGSTVTVRDFVIKCRR